MKNRVAQWYRPYYDAVEVHLAEIKKKFGYAIFFDCHSIKRKVESIRSEPFPDLILGNQDGKTCDQSIAEAALSALNHSSYEVSYNHPFKGGLFNKKFGRPEDHVHALQLEMSQDLYMDELKTTYLEDKASNVRHVLKAMVNEFVLAAEKKYENL